MERQYKKYAGAVLFLLYDLSGLRWIYEKLRPPHPKTKQKPPSTFTVWLIGSYIVLYGLTTGLYNQEKEALEARVDFLLANTTADNTQYLIDNLSRYQKTLLPVKPHFISVRSGSDFITGITSPLLSLIEIDTSDQITKKVGKIVVLKKKKLDSLSIEDLKLEQLDLTRARFSFSKLDTVSFEGSNIGGASFNEAHLSNVSFKDANFEESVDFSNSVLDNVYITYGNDEYDRPGGPRYRTVLDHAVIINSTIDLKEINETVKGFRPPIKSALVNTNIISDNAHMLFGNLCISSEQFLKLKKVPEDKYAPECENITIFFDFDSSSINVNSRKTLRLAGEVIMTLDRCYVTLEGYTWSKQTREYSLQQGDRMASAAKNYLVELGVPPSKMRTISYGKELPKYKRDYLNRRVVVNLENCFPV